MGDIRWISTAAIIVGALIIVALERWRPYEKGQRFLRTQFFNDLIMYGITQSYVMALLISWMLERFHFSRKSQNLVSFPVGLLWRNSDFS